jgi:hypothetical protein
VESLTHTSSSQYREAFSYLKMLEVKVFFFFWLDIFLPCELFHFVNTHVHLFLSLLFLRQRIQVVKGHLHCDIPKKGNNVSQSLGVLSATVNYLLASFNSETFSL